MTLIALRKYGSCVAIMACVHLFRSVDAMLHRLPTCCDCGSDDISNYEKIRRLFAKIASHKGGETDVGAWANTKDWTYCASGHDGAVFSGTCKIKGVRTKCALKIPLKVRPNPKESQETLSCEKDAYDKLKEANIAHPSIMKYYEHHQISLQEDSSIGDQRNTRHAFLMEFLEKPFVTLEDAIYSTKEIFLEEKKMHDHFVCILQQQLEAIHALAKKQLLHQAIKPGNMMYNPQEKKLKIIDFGNLDMKVSDRHRELGRFNRVVPGYVFPRRKNGKADQSKQRWHLLDMNGKRRDEKHEAYQAALVSMEVLSNFWAVKVAEIDGAKTDHMREAEHNIYLPFLGGDLIGPPRSVDEYLNLLVVKANVELKLGATERFYEHLNSAELFERDQKKFTDVEKWAKHPRFFELFENVIFPFRPKAIAAKEVFKQVVEPLLVWDDTYRAAIDLGKLINKCESYDAATRG